MKTILAGCSLGVLNILCELKCKALRVHSEFDVGDFAPNTGQRVLS
jgi:hypothetical protein